MSGSDGDDKTPKKPTPEQERKMLNTFRCHVPRNGATNNNHSGLQSLCQVLYDDQVAATPNSILYCIFFLFEMHNIPSYWWSDEELAVIADYFGYDMYIYNQTNNTALVFGQGGRPAIVLYSIEGNTRWLPGMRIEEPTSSYVPEQFAVVENVAEVLTIGEITERLRAHLINNFDVGNQHNRSLYDRIRAIIMDRLDRICRPCGSNGCARSLQCRRPLYDNDTDDSDDTYNMEIPPTAEKLFLSIYYFFDNNCARPYFPLMSCVMLGRGGSLHGDEELRAAYQAVTAAWNEFWAMYNESEDEPQPGPSGVQAVQNNRVVEVLNICGGNTSDNGRVYVRKRAVPQSSDSEADEDDSMAVHPPNSEIEDLDALFGDNFGAPGQLMDSEAEGDMSALNDDEPVVVVHQSDGDTEEDLEALNEDEVVVPQLDDNVEDKKNALNKEDPAVVVPQLDDNVEEKVNALNKEDPAVVVPQSDDNVEDKKNALNKDDPAVVVTQSDENEENKVSALNKEDPAVVVPQLDDNVEDKKNALNKEDPAVVVPQSDDNEENKKNALNKEDPAVVVPQSDDNVEDKKNALNKEDPAVVVPQSDDNEENKKNALNKEDPAVVVPQSDDNVEDKKNALNKEDPAVVVPQSDDNEENKKNALNKEDPAVVVPQLDDNVENKVNALNKEDPAVVVPHSDDKAEN